MDIDPYAELDHRADAVMKRRRLSLDELLRGVTPDNVHPEIDWGRPSPRNSHPAGVQLTATKPAVTGGRPLTLISGQLNLK